MKRTETVMLGGRELVFETGELARQADGAVVVRQGEAMVLATVVAAPGGGHGDFLPLSVEYRERMAAVGRIPGGWGRREGRQGDHEVLTSRLIDRSLRPLFPKGFSDEIQVTVTVFGADVAVDLEVLSVLAAGAAVHLAGLPFLGPVAGVRVTRVDGVLTILADESTRDRGDLEWMVSATRAGLVMVEGGAAEVSEAEVLAAFDAAVEALEPVWDAMDRLNSGAGAGHVESAPKAVESAGFLSDFEAAFVADKPTRRAIIAGVVRGAVAQGADPHSVEDAWRVFVRKKALSGVRVGARGLRDIRDIACQVGYLQSNHGSALFTRGETQALVSATIGGHDEALVQDTLHGRKSERFMLHYNFPSFSVGEVKAARGPGRREIGHGALARRAMLPVLPDEHKFGNVIRIVADILESNGSSSMATVCGASLAMMDAGIPIAAPVAGIAMGLVREGVDFAVLSDILGDEDHLGDMDFKVAGTERGITALQLDNKLGSLPRAILEQALAEAVDGVRRILAIMAKTLATPRDAVARNAPQTAQLRVPVARIGSLIGAGGRTIQELQQQTRSRIEVKDDGHVRVIAKKPEDLAAAVERIQALTLELVSGRIYEAEVVQLKDFGAFVRVGDHEGLVHISELGLTRVARTEDAVAVGQRIEVKVLGADERGRIKLSRRAALQEG